MPDQILKNDVIKKLETVLDPELNKDLVSLKMKEELKVIEGTEELKIVLTTHACRLK